MDVHLDVRGHGFGNSRSTKRSTSSPGAPWVTTTAMRRKGRTVEGFPEEPPQVAVPGLSAAAFPAETAEGGAG